MKLPFIFQSEARKLKTAFYEALQKQDAAWMGRILDGGFEPRGEACVALRNQGSPEVLKMYIQKRIRHLNKVSALYSEGQGMARDFLESGQYDRLETILETEINFNQGDYSWHPIAHVFSCAADKQKKLQWLEKMTAGGIDRIDGRDRILRSAIYYNLPEAVDLAVRLGIPPYAEDEKYLRLAAEWQNKEMCLYLVEKHGADIERAKYVARSEPNDLKAYVFLSELSPDAQKKPATLDSLSEEITALRRTVEELTQLVKQQQNPVVRLDKPSPNAKLTP
ncbi:MAG: hypothetical protein K8R48_05525 [Alphaproteobacteria bacterium]|nr:hypothetical protein [Alphaproteobacteria bacterium]